MIRPLVRTLTALLVVLVVGPAAATGASAQEDPYGGTTTTTGAGADASCELSLEQGRAGAGVTATVLGVPGDTTVRVLFGGIEVGRADAPAATASTQVDIAFEVPDVAPGRYLVTAVGGSFTARCGADADGFFAVLGAQALPRTDADGGSLPRTGVYAALLLAVAVGLVLFGRALVVAAQRRRLRLARARGSQARHLASTSSRPDR